MKINILWDVTPCSLVLERRAPRCFTLEAQGVGKHLPDYIVSHPRRRKTSVLTHCSATRALHMRQLLWPASKTDHRRQFARRTSGWNSRDGPKKGSYERSKGAKYSVGYLSEKKKPWYFLIKHSVPMFKYLLQLTCFYPSGLVSIDVEFKLWKYPTFEPRSKVDPV